MSTWFLAFNDPNSKDRCGLRILNAIFTRLFTDHAYFFGKLFLQLSGGTRKEIFLWINQFLVNNTALQVLKIIQEVPVNKTFTLAIITGGGHAIYRRYWGVSLNTRFD